MTTYYKRISDNDLKGDFVDGSVLLHTDINEIENLTKAGINANYEDIQKLRDGTISVANATSLSGAALSTSVETLQDDDTKVPTSKQVKEYVDNSATDDYSDLSNKPSINSVTLVGNKTTEDLGFIPTYYWDGTNTPENVAIFNEVCDKYTNNEPFALYGRLLLNDSWTWEGEEHYRDIAVVVPISVKNYTSRETEGSTAFSFMTDAVRMGGGYAVGSISLTGTWGNFTAVSPITWSFAEGPALKKTTVSVSEQIPPATIGNLNTVFQYVGESTEDFTKGYFYICVSDGEEEPTYSWVRINTQPGGGGGSSDYDDLNNKPQINGVTLSGNKSFEDLGINPSEQFDTMPTASSNYEDKIVQYSGDTTSSYTNGYFYKCVSDGETPATYSWEQINVQNHDETKQDKPVIDNTPRQFIALANNHEYRVNVLSSLNVSLPSIIDEDFMCSLVFSCGIEAIEFIAPNTIKWTGDGVDNNVFTPEANTRYNIVFWYDGVNVNAVSRGV